MALQSLRAAGLWVPDWVPLNPNVTASTYRIDATGEKAALIVRCPRDGTLDRFDFLIGTVTNSPDNGLRASFQTVDATTGLPTGTLLGATNSAAVTYAHTVTTGWKSTNFAETVTVTRGQLIACVIDIPSFTAGDDVTITHHNWGITSGMPYGISATSTKGSGSWPVIALHYTDGYAFISPLIPGINTQTFVSFHVNSATADEWGLGFQVPFPCKLDRIAAFFAAAAGADFEVILYDAGDNVLGGGATSIDGDITGSTSQVAHEYSLKTEVTLTANTTYRVTFRPTTTNSVTVVYWTFQSVGLMDTMEGGSNFYMTSRLNQAGSWTDYNSGTFRRPRISLHLTAFDDAVSAGALLRPVGMTGNLVHA